MECFCVFDYIICVCVLDDFFLCHSLVFVFVQY